MSTQPQKLRVLFVPDSVHWVTGTLAKNMARFNPWIEATIASGPVIDVIFAEHPELMQNFDLVHFTCPYASKRWLPEFRELIPCVTSHHHTSDWDMLKHNLDGDAIIVGSPEWKDDLQARGADTSSVFYVPYGVDTDLFMPPTQGRREAVRGQLKVSESSTLVGFFGKHSSNELDRKGIDVFLHAVKLLRTRVNRLAVLIVGPGWNELVESLKAVGIKCIWKPYVAELATLAKMYNALDFYWVTSRVEGGPVTLLEAMSSEVCCLTTPVGIAREIVCDGQNAVLLPFNDAEAFADHTAKLISDSDKRRQLAKNARQTILDEMHLAVTATRLRDVYEKAFERFNIRAKGVNASLPAYRTSTDEQFAATDVVLNGFPRAMHRRVKMLEALSWAEHLVLYQNQSKLAAKMIARECLRNPMSLIPPRVFLRRFLPVRLVATAVKLRRRSHGPANSYAR